MSNYERKRLVSGSIDVWVRRKEIYDRHQAGETYVAIARDLGISACRTAELAEWWKSALKAWENYSATPEKWYADRRLRRWAAKWESLAAAGLLGNGKRSPEYGYA